MKKKSSSLELLELIFQLFSGEKESKDEVLTLADLNDCLLESNDIVVSKTKTGIVLLKLKKDSGVTKLQQTHTKDDSAETLLKECGKKNNERFFLGKFS